MPAKQKPLTIAEKIAQGKLDSALTKGRRSSAAKTPHERVGSVQGSQMASNDIAPQKAETKKDSKPISRTAYKKAPMSASTKKIKQQPDEELKSENNLLRNEEFNTTTGQITNQPSSLTQ